MHNISKKVRINGQIGPSTTELSALECLKYDHILIMGKMGSPHFHDCLWSDPFNTCM